MEEKKRCGQCRYYMAKYCKKYDEVTEENAEVRCVGFEGIDEMCGNCHFIDDKEWCEFYNFKVNKSGVACYAWQPKIKI